MLPENGSIEAIDGRDITRSAATMENGKSYYPRVGRVHPRLRITEKWNNFKIND
jgi:hypothetical protein